MKDITTRLKSQNAVVTVLVLALAAQMPHAQYVFFVNNHDHSWFGWLQSWGGAIALEVAVLVFVIRGNTLVSWGFAAFSVAVNLIYYHDSSVAWYMPRASWLLSAGLPVAIALYSHEVADRHTDQVQPAQSVELPAMPASKHKAKPASQPSPEPQPVVAPVLVDVVAQPVADVAIDATTVSSEAQPVAIMPELQVQIDELDNRIIDAIRSGICTPYAIGKHVGVGVTTLKRPKAKGSNEYVGRLPKLAAAGYIHNSSGADGSEYRLVGE